MFWLLFKKDLRRLCLPLGIFAGSTLLEHLLGLRWVTDNYGLFSLTAGVQWILPWSNLLLLALIIPLLIHDDALVGVTAFHLTRPVPRRVLLAEKLCFALLFLKVIPALLTALVLRTHGLPLAITNVVVPPFFGPMGWFLTFFILASLTRNLRQYLISLLLFEMGSVLTKDFFASIESPGLLGYPVDSLNWSIHLLVNGLGVLLVILILAQQFRTRRTGRTILSIFAAAALLLFIVRFWTWDFLQLNALKRPRMDMGPRVEVSIDDTDLMVWEEGGAWKDGSPYYRIFARENVEGLLPRHFAVPRWLRYARITYPGGQVVRGGDEMRWRGGAIKANFDQEINVRRYALALLEMFPENTVMYPFNLKEGTVKIITVPVPAFARFKDAVGDYMVLEVFDLYEFRPTGAVPLAAGQEGRAAAQTFRVCDLIRQERGLRVILEEKMGPRNEGLSNAWDVNNFKADSDGDLEYDEAVYALRNRRTSEVFLPEVSNRELAKETLLSGALTCRYVALDYVDAAPQEGVLPRLDPDWLAEAELVRIDAVRVGYFTKEVRYPGIRLSNKVKDYEIRDGWKRTFYPTGEVRDEIEEDNGRGQDVRARGYYKSGALARESLWQDGFGNNGASRQYYEDGALMYEMEWQGGALNGRVRKYAPDGRLISDRRFLDDQDLGAFTESRPLAK